MCVLYVIEYINKLKEIHSRKFSGKFQNTYGKERKKNHQSILYPANNIRSTSPVSLIKYNFQIYTKLLLITSAFGGSVLLAINLMLNFNCHYIPQQSTKIKMIH